MFKIYNIVVILLFGLLASEIHSMHVYCTLPGFSSLASPVGFCPSTIRFSGDWRYPMKQVWDVRLADSMGQLRLECYIESLNVLSRSSYSHSCGGINHILYYTPNSIWAPIGPLDHIICNVTCHLFEFKNKPRKGFVYNRQKTCFKPKNQKLSTNYTCLKLLIKHNALSYDFMCSMLFVVGKRTSFKTMSQEQENNQDSNKTPEHQNSQGSSFSQHAANERSQEPADTADSHADAATTSALANNALIAGLLNSESKPSRGADQPAKDVHDASLNSSYETHAAGDVDMKDDAAGENFGVANVDDTCQQPSSSAPDNRQSNAAQAVWPPVSEVIVPTGNNDSMVRNTSLPATLGGGPLSTPGSTRVSSTSEAMLIGSEVANTTSESEPNGSSAAPANSRAMHLSGGTEVGPLGYQVQGGNAKHPFAGW